MQALSSKIQSVNNYSILKIILGILFICLTAQVQIPLNPVPITLQTAGVLILALCYTKKEAMQAIVGYIALGAAGIPIFAGFAGGIQVLMGARGGYIFGFILCVYLVTTLREKFGEDSWLKIMIYSAIGTIAPFALGITQLSLFIGLEKALELGLYPFIISGIVKALFTASSVRLIKTRI